MKLLLISTKSTSPAGGIAVWTEHFLSYCHRHDISCHLVNTELVGKRAVTHKRSLWSEWVRTRRIFRDLRYELKHNTFDAVYLNTSCGTYGLFRDTHLARLVYKKALPLITHYHCEIPYWVHRRSSLRALGKLAEMSRHNLVLCQNSQQFLKDHYGVTAQKVPNFVNSSLLRTTPKPIGGPVESVVFVGQVTENKGATELYAIARRLPRVQFSLVGKVSDTVAAWPKPPNVTLTGQLTQEEVISHLDRADVFLFPSHTEGCSMALMEAMARGVPAVATDTGANAEMLADSCGYVVACHDTDAMLEALHRLDDPYLRRAMSRQACDKIARHYTESNVNTLMKFVKNQSAD